jgi:hypothetical protein
MRCSQMSHPGPACATFTHPESKKPLVILIDAWRKASAILRAAHRTPVWYLIGSVEMRRRFARARLAVVDHAIERLFGVNHRMGMGASVETVSYNPFAPLLTVVRDPLLGRPLSRSVWLTASAAVLATLACVLSFARRFCRRLVYWL